MGTIIEDISDHEGYGARRLPDGTLTGIWSAETARSEAFVASCGCGWHGGEHPPPRPATRRQSTSGRPRSPTAREAIPDTVRTAINDAKRAIATLLLSDRKQHGERSTGFGHGAAICA